MPDAGRGIAPITHRRNFRLSAPTTRRYWRATAASDDAPEPAPVLASGADLSVTVAIFSSDGQLAQQVLRRR